VIEVFPQVSCFLHLHLRIVRNETAISAQQKLSAPEITQRITSTQRSSVQMRCAAPAPATATAAAAGRRTR
jgi:hypothetical protein